MKNDSWDFSLEVTVALTGKSVRAGYAKVKVR